MALDPREKLFVAAFIKKGEEYPAALEAGYKESTAKYAYEWLLPTLQNSTAKRHLPYKPELHQAIKKELEKIESDKIADATEVMEFLTSVLRGDDKEEKLTVNPMGELETVEFKSQTNRIRAAELLAKRYGILNENIKINGNINNPFEGLTTEELKKLAQNG